MALVNIRENMKFFTKKKFSESDRKAVLAQACRIVSMQIEASAAASDLYEKLHTYFALGYSFGALQASIETLTDKEISESEYSSHISEGFGVIYSSHTHGKKMYEVSRSHLNNSEFKSGQTEGINEYINILNKKTERPYELALYLHNSSITK
jgi:hypothetical protein